MTGDEATLAAGRILEIWPTCRIAFTEWEKAFLDFPVDDIHRAIDHTARTTTVDQLTIPLVLSAMSAPAPRPASTSSSTPTTTTTIAAPPTIDDDRRYLSEDARANGLAHIARMRQLMADAKAKRTPPPEEATVPETDPVTAGTAWAPTEPAADSAGITEHLEQHGVFATVDELMAEDDAGHVREPVTFDEMRSMLDVVDESGNIIGHTEVPPNMPADIPAAGSGGAAA